jgi:hypothetical protein
MGILSCDIADAQVPRASRTEKRDGTRKGGGKVALRGKVRSIPGGSWPGAPEDSMREAVVTVSQVFTKVERP